MNKIQLYYVKSRTENCVISPMIPCSNDLTAAVGFANAYIKEKDPIKNPYDYRELDLIRFAVIDESPDAMNISTTTHHVLKGSEVFDFVNDAMKKRGIDDYFIDKVPEEK